MPIDFVLNLVKEDFLASTPAHVNCVHTTIKCLSWPDLYQQHLWLSGFAWTVELKLSHVHISRVTAVRTKLFSKICYKRNGAFKRKFLILSSYVDLFYNNNYN